jgi:hypothetical protein
MNSEQLVQLLEVEDQFDLKDDGIVLAPDFALPSGRGWENYTFLVTVAREGGLSRKLRAVASPVHLLVRDPSVVRKGWRLTIVLPDATKNDVPTGSRVFCSVETYERLFGTDSAQQTLARDARNARA